MHFTYLKLVIMGAKKLVLLTRNLLGTSYHQLQWKAWKCLLFHADNTCTKRNLFLYRSAIQCPMSFYVYDFKSFTPFSQSLLHISQTSLVLSPRFTLSSPFSSLMISLPFLQYTLSPLYNSQQQAPSFSNDSN